MQFVLIFFCLSFAVSCSGIVDIIQNCYNNAIRTPKMYEGMADYCLKSKVLITGDKYTSMFDPLIKAISDRAGISLRVEYKRMMGGLDDHIKAVALSTILKARSNKLAPQEAETFLDKLHCVIEEEKYFASYALEDFVYSPRTLELIFSAIKAIDDRFSRSGLDPSEGAYSEDLILYSEFAKYCKTDTQLAVPLAQILGILEKEKKTIPFIKFNRNLVEGNEFDNFVRECHLKHCYNEKDAINLAKNIIYGPATSLSTIVLYSLGLNSIVEDLCLFYMDRNQLIRRIFKSDSCAKFFRFIENNPSNIVANLKTEMEKQFSNLQAIQIFMDLEPGEKPGVMKVNFQLFDDKSNAFEEFRFIDKNYVELCFVGIDQRISYLIEHAKAQSDSKIFNNVIVLIMKYFNLLPEMKMENFKSNNLEQVLDLMVHPLANTPLLVFEFDYLVNEIVEFPHIQVDINLFKKYFTACEAVYGSEEAADLTNSLAFVAMFNDDRDEAFDIFKIIHQFHLSEEFPSDGFVQAVIYKAIMNYKNGLAKQLIDYALEHGLVSKSFGIIIYKIRGWLYNPDYHNFYLKLTDPE